MYREYFEFTLHAMDTPMKEGFMLKAHPKDGFFSMTVSDLVDRSLDRWIR